MKKANIIVAFTTIIFFGSTCNKDNDVCNNTISIINNSPKSVYVIFDTHYPDTLYFGHSSSPTLDEYRNKISVNMSSNRPLQNKDCWETVFNYGVQIPSDTLMIYVFDSEVLDSVPWSIVVNDYIVLKRYDLSLEDLQGMNWTINYQ